MFLMPGARAGRKKLLPVPRATSFATTRNDFDLTFIQNYLSGLTLSNDATTPNTILDISAGSCTDSTNTYLMKLSAITKSISSSWALGSGLGGMGVGLTVAASTWYHVFAIIVNERATDVYFDTSVTAANKPLGTTAFRRIGSFKTTAGSIIPTFFQHGQEFWLSTPVADVATTCSTSNTSFTLASTPSGVTTQVIMDVTMFSSTQGTIFYVRESALSSVNPGFGTGVTAVEVTTGSQGAAASAYRVWTNTTQNVTGLATNANTSVRMIVRGWYDLLGR